MPQQSCDRVKYWLLGGGDAKTKSSVIEHYNSVTNEWSDWTTPLKEKLNSHCMFSVILCGV